MQKNNRILENNSVVAILPVGYGKFLLSIFVQKSRTSI